ncbi:MAG: hypothetical protein FJ291_17245 [Planctomycetes bacterium]|nr:hypothetical protein [Planctomycetota bacterium]
MAPRTASARSRRSRSIRYRSKFSCVPTMAGISKAGRAIIIGASHAAAAAKASGWRSSRLNAPQPPFEKPRSARRFGPWG